MLMPSRIPVPCFPIEEREIEETIIEGEDGGWIETRLQGDDEDDDAVKELSSESAQDPTPLLETAGGAAVDDDDDDVVSIEDFDYSGQTTLEDDDAVSHRLSFARYPFVFLSLFGFPVKDVTQYCRRWQKIQAREIFALMTFPFITIPTTPLPESGSLDTRRMENLCRAHSGRAISARITSTRRSPLKAILIWASLALPFTLASAS